MRLLHISSSPRGSESVSIAVATAYVDACRARYPDLEVDTLDVWAEDLPEFAAAAVDVKYKLVSGEPMTDHQARTWERVRSLVDRVRRADRIVLGVPMWNWSYPYKLKQLIDLVTQRGELFTFDGQTYGPNLDIEHGLIVCVRGQSWSTHATAPDQSCDHQLDFLRFWLQLIGARNVDAVRVELAWGPDKEDAITRGVAEVRRLAANC